MSLFDVAQFRATSPQAHKMSLGCGACKLNMRCANPKLTYTGKGEKGILFVGSAPTLHEDRKGIAGTGESFIQLKELLSSEFGISFERDCWFINATGCPSGKKAPTPEQVVLCRSRVFKAIEALKPCAVFLLGTQAIQSVIGNYYDSDLSTMEKWRGWTIPLRTFQTWACPVFDLAYLAQAERFPDIHLHFTKDLARGLRRTEKPFPYFKEERTQVEIISDENELAHRLNLILDMPPPLLSFDYETTGLKPQRKGHQIICTSYCFGEGAVAFMQPEKGSTCFSLWRKILADKRIKKAAHNMKFENVWSRIHMGVQVQSWEWDSMIAAHVLDNRGGISSLKFQAFIRYGLADYSSHISPLLKATTEESVRFGGNAFNQVKRIPKQDLLLYCGIDSLVEHQLCMDQMEEMSHGLGGV